MDKPQSKEQGFILIWTLLMMFMLMALGMAVLSLSTQNLRLTQFMKQRQQAFYAAESALNMALIQLKTNKPTDTDKAKKHLEDHLPPAAIGNAKYKVHSANGGNPNRLVITGIGEVEATGGGTRTVRISMEAVKYGYLFPEKLVDLEDTVKWADYEVRHFPWSDAIPAEDSGQLKTSSTINGEFSHFSSISLHGKGKELVIDAKATSVTIYVDGDFSIGGGAKVVLSGKHPVHIYVGGDVQIGDNGGGKDNDAASLSANLLEEWAVFHVKGGLHLHGNATIGSFKENPTENPNPALDDANLVFLMDTEVEDTDKKSDGKNRVHINGNATISGGIYAPTRRVQFSGNNVNLDGSIVGKPIEINPDKGSMDHKLKRFLADDYWGLVAGTWREN